MTSSLKIAAVFALTLFPALAAAADKPVRIGVLNDQSSVYADYQGEGSVIAARLAVEDFGNRLGAPVEVVTADHQNKVDVGSVIAQRWFDQEGVDMIVDVPNSAIALAVNTIAKDRNKVFIGSGAGTAELTGKACTPNTVHWTYDTWSLGHSFGRAVTRRGGKKWFFITADYAFGKDLEAQASEEVKAQGGEVIGAVRPALGTPEFSTFLVQAQSSGADVIAFAVAGGDLTNALKQAAEFGMTGRFHMPAFVFNINNVQALGLAASQGVLVITPFYWDMNEATRAFAKRFSERHPRKLMPNDMQAGVYAAVTHYLKAVAALKSAADGRAVVAKMKETPTDDPLFGKGVVRADGRKTHPVFLYEVKKPSESKGGWDYFKLLATIPAEEAYRPLSQGHCPLVKG